MKQCTKCKEFKPATTEFFHKKKGSLQTKCKECRKNEELERHYQDRERILERKRNYYFQNKEWAKAKQQEHYWSRPEVERQKAKERHWLNRNRNNRLSAIYRQNNQDKLIAYMKEWRKNNKSQHNLKCKEYKRRQRATNPTYVLSNRVGRAIAHHLKRNKNGKSWKKYLNFTPQELKEHLESQFTDGMTWQKFLNAEIHIDHIKPVSAFYFDSIYDSEFQECWSLENLQPLWAKDNIRKSNHYE